MYFDDTVQNKLRAIGKINHDEVLIKEGDLYIVLNVVSQQRRIIPGDASLLEALNLKSEGTSKQLLKG